MWTHQFTKLPQRGLSFQDVGGHGASRHSSPDLQLDEPVVDCESSMLQLPESQGHTLLRRSEDQTQLSPRDNVPPHGA
ncbi:hypothetical protein PC120_g8313 [Phytophthora cactorum]|nr:hypothetical protein PC120_g8313 [Phytophthora cactorum]